MRWWITVTGILVVGSIVVGPGSATAQPRRGAGQGTALGIGQGPPCAVNPLQATHALLSDEGDVALEGGGTGRIVGIAAGPAHRGDLTPALREWIALGPFAVVTLDEAPDRWGRVPVHLVRGGRTVAEDLVAEGRAVVRPEGLSPRCLQALLSLERSARVGRVGLWVAPPLLAADREGLLAAEGRFTVVEGRIRSIGRTAGALYLNFDGLGTNDFAVTIPKRSLRRFEASGMTDPEWQGRRVRVRGIVLGRERPRMEVTVPEALERLD